MKLAWIMFKGADGQQVEVVPTLADDGRRTKTRSEFVLSMRPDAVGVMLRRRLDLEYPNQKAVVYVADAATEKPEWEEAGTWYTAGGNTVVFGDPRVHSRRSSKRSMSS